MLIAYSLKNFVDVWFLNFKSNVNDVKYTRLAYIQVMRRLSLRILKSLYSLYGS